MVKTLVNKIRGITEDQELGDGVTEGSVRSMNKQLEDHLGFEKGGNMTQRLISGLIDTAEASTWLHQATPGTRDKARPDCCNGVGD